MIKAKIYICNRLQRGKNHNKLMKGYGTGSLIIYDIRIIIMIIVVVILLLLLLLLLLLIIIIIINYRKQLYWAQHVYFRKC
jgi:hypothetical protein